MRSVAAGNTRPARKVGTCRLVIRNRDRRCGARRRAGSGTTWSRMSCGADKAGTSSSVAALGSVAVNLQGAPVPAVMRQAE
ncbi:hypothetical protein [Amycolatopsis sp. NBC_00438]|uniref:hypothetical protein n=1 Tax=Amycolatopsis sp. NBC_00438 TaxID=2903558 RepID=UPI002E1EC155